MFLTLVPAARRGLTFTGGIAVIESNAEYQTALARVSELMDAKMHSDQELVEFLDLVGQVEEYEERHWPIGPPDPGEAARFHAEQEGRGSS